MTKWLADFQAEFGNAIRTPLDRSTGTLTAITKGGMATYNRQYWFRLFEVMQEAYPRTAKALGYWAFNAHAARFLEANPPKSWNLDDVPHGFDRFYTPEDPSVRDALRADAVARAPIARPTTLDAADAQTQLVPSPSVALFVDHALVRRANGLETIPLAPREAELLALLAEHPLGEALARFGSEDPASVQAWLAKSVANGFWLSHTRRS